MNKENLFRGLQITEEPYSETWLFGGINSSGDNLIISDSPAENINPKTISRFTGFFDTDGNKIFEGDVSFSYGLPANNFLKIDYDESAGRWIACFFNNVFSFELNNRSARYLKIVGNIYQKENLVNICKNIIEGVEPLNA